MSRFDIYLPNVKKGASVYKSEVTLNISIKELDYESFAKSLPLDQYYVTVAHSPGIQTDHKVYKTKDGKWYEPIFSPEYGAPELNREIKNAIDAHERNPIIGSTI